MSQYNQQYPYDYQQHTPGPPQPQWQAPPRRQGWFDPRHQEQQTAQSPVSPVQHQQFGYPPPPPPPPPPPALPPTQSPRPHVGPHDTYTWGVKYNHQDPQTEQYRPQWNEQNEEYRPPLPPRPSSSTAHHGPISTTSAPLAHYGHGPSTSLSTAHYVQGPTTSASIAHYGQGPTTSASTAHYGPSPQSAQWPTSGRPSSPAYPAQNLPPWQDPYRMQSQTTTYNLPPPPPPRPLEYQAEIQAQLQADSMPHQHYSHQPPSHHYDPQASKPHLPSYPIQQHGMTFASPSTPPDHMAYPSADPTVVSPIGSETQHWPQQLQAAALPDAKAIQAPKPQSKLYSSALGSGGPSDWEHFNDAQNVSPEMSSPTPVAAISWQPPNVSSPPQLPAGIAHEAVSSSDNTAPMQQQSDSNSWQPRNESDNPSIPAQGINRAATIDSLIQAWNKPLNFSAKPTQPPGSRPQSRGQVPQQPPERIVEVEKIVEKVVDPYDDLQPEFKASLKRYVSVLRKETVAETDEAKFDIFQQFVKKELRLRTMLYGIEPQSPRTHAGKRVEEGRSQPVRGVPTSQQQASPAQPVLPPPPVGVSTVDNGSSLQSAMNHAAWPVQQLTSSESVQPEVVAPARSDGIRHDQPRNEAPEPLAAKSGGELASARPATPPPLAPLQTPATESLNISPQSKDDSFVVVSEGHDEAEYSPGGRPRISRPQVTANTKPQLGRRAAQLVSIGIARNNLASPSADAPMVLEDYMMAQPPSPGANAPILIEPNSASDLPQVVTDDYGPADAHSRNQRGHSAFEQKAGSLPAIKFEPSRPAYLPFKYNSSIEVPKQPADQSYSSLRKDAVDSGRLLVHEPASALGSVNGSRSSSPRPVRAQDEAFIGLIRSQSKAIRPKKTTLGDLSTIPQLRPGTPRATTPVVETPAGKNDDLSTATNTLRSMLPKSVPERYGLSQHVKANAVKAKVDTLPDSFSFIHETVLVWDRKNREVCKKQDDERHARQVESEAHIDGLFNDNEIGYADIGDLEADFKLAEAERKYREDQGEVDSFTKDVHQIVIDRLRQDIAELNAQYTIAVDILDLESGPASSCLQPDDGKPEMDFVMSCVLSIFNKLEIRHQKIAEADVERERRRKRLELTVLYTNGDTHGVKQLEQEYAVAEKMQVLHKARAKDTRANKLMDTFDRATVRGLGDNQTYIDDVLVQIKELRKLIHGDSTSVPQEVYTPQGARDTLTLAQETIDFVLADSQKLLTVSNVADKLLNDADYSVSVAEAQVSNANQVTYQKLAQEKEKEDSKIVEDTNARMSTIGKAAEEVVALIREIVDRVGDDAEHRERLKKSLEAAKQRNAAHDAIA